jgi:hypothetical protein
LDSDPWLWRVKIVNEAISAYGKFFGTKATFIHVSLFPEIKTILSSNRSIEERYRDGLISIAAYDLYKILLDHGNIDSRNLRKSAGLNDKEDKKVYERALVELQNFGDVVITGAKESDNESGWSSMCYELADSWLTKVGIRENLISIDDAKTLVTAHLSQTCSDQSYKYLAKKLYLKGD